MLEEVTTALAAIGGKGTFATEIACDTEALRVVVEGVGPLRLPISPATARKLQAIAKPAPFGRRDRTLHDTSVRDTGEIAGSRVEVDARWSPVLERKLSVIANRLGLNGKLVAVLDKLLVYGPGQFFASHQDSERADDMVGSLVVLLPSKHQGGALVVQHHDDRVVLGEAPRGSKELMLIAFYADCQHEVQPVTSGHRIALTYHLHHRAAGARRAPRTAVDRLATSVEAYFATAVPIRYSNAPPQPPDRLIYLLDHQYTQRSLSWKRLKGADRRRAAALREVAERLDCEVFLALADVHESWSCENDWSGYERYGYDEDEDDEDAEVAGDDEYTLVDLIGSDVQLRHWIGPDDAPAQAVSVSPSSDEVCFTRASVDMDPFQSQHEGYMGNYGNTVDRWYHRAAIVMWPRARNFVLRAKVSPSWAAKEIKKQIAAGATDAARARVKDLSPFWSEVAGQETGERFVADLLAVAAALGDASLASDLLSPLGPHRLGARTMTAFAALVERFGPAWGERIFSTWAERARWSTPPWLSSLPQLCQALMAAGEHGATVAVWLLTREVASFEDRHVSMLKLPSHEVEKREQVKHLDELLSLLEAAASLQAGPIRDELLAFLTSPATALPLLSAGVLLQECRASHPPATLRALGLGALHRYATSSLEKSLAAPPRSPDDWSIAPPPGCACELCRDLAAFLSDRQRIELAWPLSEERRRHIHGVIDRHRLPVTHVTRRSGRPYTLVLTKQRALFERDAALRAQQQVLLSWLRKERASFQ